MILKQTTLSYIYDVVEGVAKHAWQRESGIRKWKKVSVALTADIETAEENSFETVRLIRKARNA